MINGRAIRKSRYLKEDNCSIVRIEDNEVFIFGKKIVVVANTATDWKRGIMHFYYTKETDLVPLHWEDLELPMLVGMEVINAFEEIQQENKRKVESLFAPHPTNSDLGSNKKKGKVPSKKNTSGVSGTKKK